MADNLQLSAAVGTGEVLASDDIGGVQYAIGKVAFGALDSATLVTTSAGFPVQQQTGHTFAVSLAATSDFNLKQYGGSAVGATNAVHVQAGTGATFPVTDNSGSLTVDNAGTFAVQESGAALTSLQLIDNIVLAEDAAHVSGDPGVMALTVRKDTAAATSGTDGDYQPPITDANGKLWVNAGGVTLTVASHDVTNAGTFAVQAAQSGTWNVGTVTTLTGITNVVHVDDNASTLSVDDGGGSLTVDGSVTVSGTVTATLGANVTEDAASAGGETSVLIAGVRNDAAASKTSTDGDFGNLAIDSAGRVGVCDLGGSVSVDDNGGSLTVDGTVAATQSGTWTVQPGNTANTTAWLVTGTGGTFPVTDSGGSLTVDNGGTFAVQPAGSVAHDGAGTSVNPVLQGAYASAAAPTDVSADGDAVRLWALRSGALAVQQTYGGVLASTGNGASGTGVLRVAQVNDGTGVLAGVTTVTTVTTLSNGQTAHDGASTGSPLRVGAKAETSLSTITTVADGDATDLYAGVDGVLITRPHTNLEEATSGVAAITDGSSTSVISAAGAGVKIYITTVIIANSSSSNVTVDLRDGTAGSVKATFPAPANGGCVLPLPVPLGFSANTAVAADPSASASTITVTLIGFKSKV